MQKTKFRPRLSEWELRQLRGMTDDRYRLARRNVRYEKNRVKAGRPDSRIYPLSEQEAHLKKLNHLLRKLNRLLDGKYVINS